MAEPFLSRERVPHMESKAPLHAIDEIAAGQRWRKRTALAPIGFESLVDQPVTSSHLAAALGERVPLTETGLGLMMLLLGRYDYVPADAVARTRLAGYRSSFRRELLGDVIDFGARWQPWSGLAYWLWEWPETVIATDHLAQART